MKKTSKRTIVISSLSFLVFLIIGGAFIFSKFGDKGKLSYIDFKQKDYYNFQTIGKYIFKEMDNSQYKIGCEYFIESHVLNREAFYLDDNNIKNILEKYYVSRICIIDKDSIMFNCGSYFQQTGGVIITRNGFEPATNYKNKGFDSDKIDLSKIDEGIYSYTAGL